MVAAALALPASLFGTAMPVLAADCPEPGHCYSNAYESSAGNGYTGVRASRYILDLDNPSGNPVYSTMWLIWQWSPSRWIEVGTMYKSHKTKNFGYLCVPTFCDFIFTLESYHTEIGLHTWKINRDTNNHDTYIVYIDGDLISSQTSPYNDGQEVEVGLETYNTGIFVEPHAYYNLRYKRWDGSFEDWAGKDGQTTGFTIMCGQWHLPTSWWAGEHASCA